MFSTSMTSICDRERLLQALDQTLSSWTTYAPYLDFFRRRLRCSRAVAAHQIPGDVITMNSRFALHDDRRGDTICCTLVYPEDEAPLDGKVSVLSPMGMVLYGARVGEEVRWIAAGRAEVATVERLLYQPDA